MKKIEMTSSFLKEFFDEVVSAYSKTFLVKKVGQHKKLETNIEKKLKTGQVKEKIKFKKDLEKKETKKPVFIERFFDVTNKLQQSENKAIIDIERITDKKLKPANMSYLASQETEDQHKKNLVSSTINLINEKTDFPVPNRIDKEENKIKVIKFDFGKLNDLIYNREFEIVQISNDTPVLVYNKGKVEKKDLVLRKNEIMDLLIRLSRAVKIPLDTRFSCYIEDFFVQADIGEKINVIIKKLV